MQGEHMSKKMCTKSVLIHQKTTFFFLFPWDSIQPDLFPDSTTAWAPKCHRQPGGNMLPEPEEGRWGLSAPFNNDCNLMLRFCDLGDSHPNHLLSPLNPLTLHPVLENSEHISTRDTSISLAPLRCGKHLQKPCSSNTQRHSKAADFLFVFRGLKYLKVQVISFIFLKK